MSGTNTARSIVRPPFSWPRTVPEWLQIAVVREKIFDRKTKNKIFHLMLNKVLELIKKKFLVLCRTFLDQLIIRVEEQPWFDVLTNQTRDGRRPETSCCRLKKGYLISLPKSLYIRLVDRVIVMLTMMKAKSDRKFVMTIIDILQANLM